MVDFKMLDLKKLTPSPTNPRKSFDTSKTIELAESIKEKGVLQPILVRPKGNGYEIVCGERRYKASQMVATQDKKRNTIPAIIRELSDQEVREMQLIENFQREDVHPMEEAVAIRYALETGKYTIEEIKIKTGKSITYLRQREKLSYLIDKWKTVFYNKQISITLALKIAQFTQGIQEQLFEDFAKDEDGEIEIRDWSLAKYEGEISEARFDVEDATIIPSAGSCMKCHFNTAVAQLFPDEVENAKCTNISCFKAKSNAVFERELKKVTSNLDTILISSNYSSFDDDNLVKELNSGGFDVYLSNRYNELSEPEKPTIQSFEENEFDEDDGKTLDEAFAEKIAEYEAEMNEFEEDKKKGYVKAFCVDGRERGEYLFVKILENNPSKKTVNNGKPLSEEQQAIDNIDTEINNLKFKHNRAIQLDENKIWDDLKDSFEPKKNHTMLAGFKIEPIEAKVMVMSILSKLSFHRHDDFKKYFRINNKTDYGTIDSSVLVRMLKYFSLDVLPPNSIYNGHTEESSACMELADLYFPVNKNEVINSFTEKSESRQKRFEKKIGDLNEQKKEILQKNSKKNTKEK